MFQPLSLGFLSRTSPLVLRPYTSFLGSHAQAARANTQPYLNSAKFNLPLFSPNNILLSFQPDPASQSLPEPGRGGKIEAKIIVGEGAGHGIWKMIEGERERWLAIKREENTLRESLSPLPYIRDVTIRRGLMIATYSAGSKQGERRLL
jgi:hypothetical protein